MKKQLIAVLIALFTMLLLVSSVVSVAAEESDFIPDVLIVAFLKGTPHDQMESQLFGVCKELYPSEETATIQARLHIPSPDMTGYQPRICKLTIQEEQIPKAVSLLEALADVDYVERDYSLEIDTPDDRRAYFEAMIAEYGNTLIHVKLSHDVTYSDSFAMIREIAAVIYPGKTAEECGKWISYEPADVEFFSADPERMADLMVIIEQKDYVTLVDCIPLNSLTCMYPAGDANNDGETDAADYLLVKKTVLGTGKLSLWCSYLSDVNWDQAVDSIDYLLIKRMVLGLLNQEDSLKPGSWVSPFTGKPASINVA